MNRFQFVAGLHRRHGVKRLCSILGISRSSFCYWRRTTADRAARQAADARLAALIRAVHQDSDGTYGAPRITAELRETSGEALNHKRVARIMRAFGIEGVRTRGSLAGSIMHTDHGAQYTSRAFAEACSSAGVRRSMSAVGSSADNALAESFNATFKRETLQGRKSWPNEREARLDAFRWLNRCNTRRRHSHLGQRPRSPSRTPSTAHQLRWHEPHNPCSGFGDKARAPTTPVKHPAARSPYRSEDDESGSFGTATPGPSPHRGHRLGLPPRPGPLPLPPRRSARQGHEHRHRLPRPHQAHPRHTGPGDGPGPRGLVGRRRRGPHVPAHADGRCRPDHPALDRPDPALRPQSPARPDRRRKLAVRALLPGMCLASARNTGTVTLTSVANLLCPRTTASTATRSSASSTRPTPTPAGTSAPPSTKTPSPTPTSSPPSSSPSPSTNPATAPPKSPSKPSSTSIPATPEGYLIETTA